MKKQFIVSKWCLRAIPLLLMLALAGSGTMGIDSPVLAAEEFPAAPLDTPTVVVNEQVDEYVITDGMLYWARKCWGGEFRGPGYLRRKPTHGGGTLTLQETTADICYTFWWMNADETGVYYVNYENNTLVFRPTDNPSTPTVLFTFTTSNDPISQLELSDEYIYWAAENTNIYRLPKAGGSEVAIRSGLAGLRDIEQWADNQLYWLQGDGLYICGLPSCSSGSKVSTHTGYYLHSWFIFTFWVEQGSPQSIWYRACFIDCSVAQIYQADPAGAWVINRPSVGLCADGTHYCLYWEEYSTSLINGRVRRKALEGGTAAETLADNLLRGNNPTETDDLGVYFLLSEANNYGLGRLPFTTSVVSRDLYALEWEVTQGLQSLSNDVPLVANKPTYVRLYPDLTGTHANYVDAWLVGERSGVPLPGSPLAPLNGPFQMDDTWDYDRNDINTGFLFQLPESWITAGTITLRGVVDPRAIYADLNPANNTRQGTFTFNRVPPVCDIFMPVRTHTPAINTSTLNFWRMIDIQKRVWPVPDVWVYHQNSDIAEPQVCWWGIIPYPCYGPFELDEGTSWSDWVKDDEEALLHVGARAAFSDDPDECDDLGSAVHYVGMVHPDAPWGWGGLAYTNDILQPASLVVMPPRTIDPPLDWTWPWEGGSLAHETAHNQERFHVDCGDPAGVDTSYPYPVCAIDDSIPPTHFGFDVNLRQPIAPEIASDLMSYSGRNESATWQGRWISDYTYNALFNRVRTSSDLEVYIQPSLTDATNSVLVNASIDPDTQQGVLNPAWVFPTGALSSGMLEKWEAMLAVEQLASEMSTAAVNYHLRLRDGGGNTLADYALTPLETEIHHDEVLDLTFMQTFAAPAGSVRRLDLMADSSIIATLEPGPAAPMVNILEPAGGETYVDQMTIRWTASDPDPNDHLLFTIQYSPDAGLTWKSVATNLPAIIEGDENQLQLVDLSGLGASDGPNGLIRVAATDGYNTTLVVSSPFSVADQPPQPYILSPESTHYYQPGEAVPLRGGAMDPETGGLSGSQLVWKIYGVTVGTGAEISLYGLGPGSYPLVLEATDPAANMATSSALLNVSRLQIPQASQPILDGLCEDTQYSGAQITLEPYSAGARAAVKLLRTSDALWACFSGMQKSVSTYIGFAGLRVDVNNSRDEFAQTDDYGFFVDETGTPLTRSGNGSGGFNNPGPGGLLAQISMAGSYWSAELRIDASVLGGWDHPIGLELEQYRRLTATTGQLYNWPFVADVYKPQTWAWTILGNLPAIDSLSPENATAGGPAFNLTVTGSNFQDGATVKWMTSDLPTTFVDSTQLTATVDTGLITTGKYALLTVRNLSGLTSDAVVFTVLNPRPTITALDPAGLTAGSPGFTLKVSGNGFMEGSQVLWNGLALTSTFANKNTLNATVPAEYLTYASPAMVTVINPEPAGGQSDPYSFTIGRSGILYLPFARR